MNKVILLGRLAKDPILRKTQSGIPVCSFSVACARRYVKAREEEKTDFINCIAWHQTGEFVSRYFAKGNRIALEGRLQPRNRTDNDGKKCYTTEVMVDNVEFAQSLLENNDNRHSGELEADGFVPINIEDLPF